MNKYLASFLGGIVCSLFAVNVVGSQPQTAPAAVVKVLLSNSDVTVTDSVYAPGATNPMAQRPRRVIYVIAGPLTSKLTYADGHTEMLSHNTGDVFWQDPGNVSITNAGTNQAHVLAVLLKR